MKSLLPQKFPSILKLGSRVRDPAVLAFAWKQRRCLSLSKVQTDALLFQHGVPSTPPAGSQARSGKHGRRWSLALTVDRENYRPAFILSPSPDRTTGNRVDDVVFGFKVSQGVTDSLVSGIAEHLHTASKSELEGLLQAMCEVFINKDATHLELVSLGRSPEDKNLTWADSRCTIDDAAAKRQPELFSQRDVSKEVQEEVEAEKHGLIYVRMDGNIGNVVNGAGLAMATNDAISLYGGSSANFLDAGGQATKETMIQAFRIVLSDPRVKVILVNVYGGITRCDMIAESIIGAAKELGPLKVPIVARLQGTNSAAGLKLLEEANIGIHVEAGFGDVAETAVRLSKMNE